MKYLGLFIAMCAVAGCVHKEPDYRHYKNDMGYELSGPDAEKVRQVVKSNLKEVKGCYEKGLTSEPTMGGKVVLVWTIDDHGKASDVTVKSSKIRSREVEDCMVAKIKTWKFPSTPSGDKAEITFPFIFSSTD